MKARLLSVGYITVIVMLVLHLLPVWGFKYFPTQDGASHIYNSYVVKEYHNHENYRLPRSLRPERYCLSELDIPRTSPVITIHLSATRLRKDSADSLHRSFTAFPFVFSQ